MPPIARILRPRQRRPMVILTTLSLVSLLLFALTPTAVAVHHMQQRPPRSLYPRDDRKPLVIISNCSDTIHPAITTQAGSGPESGGFELGPNESMSLTVSADWQGRVWGRTNCSFNSDGTGPAERGGRGNACGTGDCGGILDCQSSGEVPVSLAEFTLETFSGQTFYDISLVDGYNLPMAITSLHESSGNDSISEIPPNLTNPVCIGTADLLAAEGYDPYSDSSQTVLGTNSTYPLSFDQSSSMSDVQGWCPWDLQLDPPSKPGDGVYPYPDDTIQRPAFNPCYSACAKYNKPEDCCSGAHDQPSTCSPSYYSKQAKKVCPDAYSYAFDDQDATFVIPSGGGFEVIFCPPGRSTTILSSKKDELTQLANTGQISLALAQKLNTTGQKSRAISCSRSGSVLGPSMLAALGIMLLGGELI
ncbi:MAG: hypothetical protein M1812_002178 [Candelaria pacifica]|nr:MAG: hypothetical protein M1812_002178 [Candelaria pacifica]